MALPLPSSLSPSKIASFQACPLAFRYSEIDRIPEPPSPWATKGTLVHKALELLFWQYPVGRRTPEAAAECVDVALAMMREHPEYIELALDEKQALDFAADAQRLVRQYFRVEDPNQIRAVGTELMLQTTLPDGVILRGIIDRLELDGRGGLIVTDYKTGRAPHQGHEQRRMEGVHLYAYLCESVIGVRPSRVQLMYLAEPVVISTEPSPQKTNYQPKRCRAIWSAIDRACARENFAPNTSVLCSFCSYKPYCPAHGGDPALAMPLANPKPMEPPPLADELAAAIDSAEADVIDVVEAASAAEVSVATTTNAEIDGAEADVIDLEANDAELAPGEATALHRLDLLEDLLAQDKRPKN